MVRARQASVRVRRIAVHQLVGAPIRQVDPKFTDHSILTKDLNRIRRVAHMLADLFMVGSFLVRLGTQGANQEPGCHIGQKPFRHSPLHRPFLCLR